MSFWDIPIPPYPVKPVFPVRVYFIDGEWSVGHTKGSRTSKASEKGRASWQERSWEAVANAGGVGLTSTEAMAILGDKNFSVRPSLSTMHLATMLGMNYVTALKEERFGANVYVLPCYVNGREEEPRHFHGANEMLYDIVQGVIALCRSGHLEPEVEAMVRAAMSGVLPEEEE